MFTLRILYHFLVYALKIQETKQLTDIAGERAMFPIDTFNSSNEGMVY